MEIKKTTKERVQDISVRTFTIASCPEKVYQGFIKFCKENARNVRFYRDEHGKTHEKEEIVYHMGLRILLDAFEADAKSMMLFERLKTLESRIAKLENKPEKSERKKIKTFGGN